MTEARPYRLTQNAHWFRYWMPYTYHRLQHPTRKYVYLPLNRNYKPLGVRDKDCYTYQEYMPQAVAFRTDPTKFVGIWWLNNEGGLWLYSDSEESRKTYFTRLQKLMLKSQHEIGAWEADPDRLPRAWPGTYYPSGGYA